MPFRIRYRETCEYETVGLAVREKFRSEDSSTNVRAFKDSSLHGANHGYDNLISKEKFYVTVDTFARREICCSSMEQRSRSEESPASKEVARSISLRNTANSTQPTREHVFALARTHGGGLTGSCPAVFSLRLCVFSACTCAMHRRAGRLEARLEATGPCELFSPVPKNDTTRRTAGSRPASINPHSQVRSRMDRKCHVSLATIE